MISIIILKTKTNSLQSFLLSAKYDLCNNKYIYKTNTFKIFMGVGVTMPYLCNMLHPNGGRC